MPEATLRRAVAAVVESGNCSGCGGCSLVSPAIRIERSADGYNRPALPPEDAAGSVEEFLATCPGSRVEARHPAGAARDPLFGPYFAIYEAHATDPETRHAGSSGGALTAIAEWLVASGRAGRAVTAGQDPDRPSASTTASSDDPEAIKRGAGSRYAPVSTLTTPAVLLPDTAVVAKPCEATALTQLSEHRGVEPPTILSFFCAGVPSQHATDELVQELGVSLRDVSELRYRGQGWPGRFTATRADGSSESLTYEESWGRVLGRRLQWRCKICPDGVGESSDITAGDFWEADERGYPVFTEAGGRSVLIARTRRGAKLLSEAIAEGVIHASPIEAAAIHPVQPLQVNRRSELAARLAGVRAAGLAVPKYRGFGLWALALRRPVRAARSGVGAFKRIRRGER